MQERRLMSKLAVGLSLGVLLGAIVIPLCTLLAVLITDLGPGGYRWTTLPWGSYVPRGGLALLWGMQVGGLSGVLLTLLDSVFFSLPPKRRSPANR